ncbi:hypothetical protein B566_EDAN012332 [Ephemera danica]|nr:hypothetical protein B566_EDAN012332 [Ephemera danica]
MNKLTFVMLVCALAAVAYAQTARRPVETVYRKESLVPSGAYTSEYITANGIRVEEHGTPVVNDEGETVIVKSGNYAYTSPEGVPVSISYVADFGGFRAAGEAIPKDSQIAGGLQLTFVMLVCALAAVAYAQTARRPAETVYRKESLVPSGAYTSSFKTSNGIVSEERGHVVQNDEGEDVIIKDGSYSYTSPEGVPVSISYVADENGFRAEGDSIPKIPHSQLFYTMNKLIFVVLVCALAAVAYAQSVRRPETVYRKESLVPSGAYTSNFTTTNGIRVVDHGEARKNKEGDTYIVKSGNYAYTSPEGVPVSVAYVADEFGFRAVGDVIPKDENSPQ